VYAYAAACYLGIQTYREPGWARREALYAPREPDLFVQTPAPAKEEKKSVESLPPPQKPQPRNEEGWNFERRN
jgi:hypothetical protein